MLKNKIWLLQIPIAGFLTFAFYVSEAGIQGKLSHPFLRENIFPTLRTVSSWFTDRKFKIRGPQPPKNKIIIVDIDSIALERLGRWPWHRDLTAYLIEKTFQAGAKVVGLDTIFAEPDVRVPEELAELLQKRKMGDLAKKFETDFQLETTIRTHQANLILGWTTETICQPAFEKCPVTDAEIISTHPKGQERFAYSILNFPYENFDPLKTPLFSLLSFTANIPIYTNAAQHAGHLNALIDPDGHIRRTPLFLMANGKPYPSLSLEMARVALNEKLELDLDSSLRVAILKFANSGRTIPVSPLGTMEINFRGPGNSFQYVHALEVMRDEDEIQIEVNRKLASTSKKKLLKDALVFIGISALGVYDMRAFPFDSNVPGVEGHANILDNLLSGDPLIPGSQKFGHFWILLLMTVGALVFAYLTEKFESIPALLLFLFATSGLGIFDQKILFDHDINWDLSFLYIELFTIFVLTLAIKYVLEEKNKKFIRGAFSKYVAPAIVDSIIKDPKKLSIGGEKRELTILFSDIRGFTTFSEKMDAKALAGFLNDYLGIMTDIVFEHQGTLDKYIGDAVMAFWGAPLEQSKHPANACKAAIHMLKALYENRERFKACYGIDVDIGIGINSGSVNVGNMGSERIFEYTVIGDHVNLASRVEGLTKAYGAHILTTRFTFDLIQKSGEPLPPHRVLDRVKVKGKKTVVELIQLLDKDLSAEGLHLFEEARILYTQQKWDQAIEKFKQANELLASDVPCETYIERCLDFKKTSPGTEWDGSWEMTSK